MNFKKFVGQCVVMLLVYFFSLACLWAQPYGLTRGAAIGPYLNSALPASAPNSSATYDVTVAYTNLVFNQPLFFAPYPNTNWQVVIEKAGVIRIFPNRPNVATSEVKVFLDLSSRVFTTSDCGMTCIAFHPQFGMGGSTNRGYVYVTYKWRPNPDLGANVDFSYYRLSRFTVPDGTMAANPNSEVIMLEQFDQQEWHDSGCLMFGQDGYLYFGVGDEGGANDQYNVTQIINQRLMSGIFRIDVNQDPTTSHPIRMQPFHHPNTPVGWPESFSTNYFVPNENPFVNAGGTNLEEFYALGFRNPYRFTQDPATGRIWVGDVGQDTCEEVDTLLSGRNYQWAYMEGSVAGPKAKPVPVIGIEQPPLWSYLHQNGDGCVIGGYVYHGSSFPGLAGKYITVDNDSGRIWAVASTNGLTLDSVQQIATMPPGSVYGGTSSCGLDANGEIYFVKIGGVGAGQIYELKTIVNFIADPVTPLSQLGLFTNLATLAPVSGFHGYTVNSPLWSDGAVKKRWLAVPNGGTHNTPAEQVIFSPTNEWKFPAGTVFVKHFDLPVNDTNTTVTQRVETRLLVVDQNGAAYGLTYRWRADGSDADLLVTGTNANFVITGASGILRTQVWSFPSRQDCLVCHNANASYVLGVKTHQLNCPTMYAETGVTDNQLRALGHIGLLGTNYSEAQLTNYLKSYAVTNTAVSLELRARSYIDANCSQCHRPIGVQAYFDARYVTPLAQQGLIQGPAYTFITDTNDRVVVPKDLPHSLLYNRANRVGQFQMPPLAKNLVDSNAVQVIASWINSLPLGPGAILSTPLNYVNGSFAVQVQLTAPVSGLTLGDFQVVNGTAGSLTGGGANYSIVVTPTAYGTVTVQLPAAVVQDASSNPNYASNPLNVTYSQFPFGLLHRWSFNDGTDAVGGANATLVGTANFSGGKLRLPGGGPFANYAQVNITNTLDTKPSLTIETWFTINVAQNWSKVWMFGQNAAGEPALSFINYTPQTALAGNPPKIDFDPAADFGFDTTGGANPPQMQTGVPYHVVVIYDSTNNLMSLYINGALADSAPMGGYNLTQLQADTARFGCGFYFGDPDFSGSIDELRIWQGVLSPTQISQDYLSGPNSFGPGNLLSISLSAATTNIDAHGLGVPLQVLALFSNATNVDVTSLPQVTYGSSNTNVAVVQNAQIVPKNPGGTIITATYGAASASLAVSVFDTNNWPVLLHRYSFNPPPGSTTVTDLAGTINGTLHGLGTFTGSQFTMPPGNPAPNADGTPNASGGWVSFPAGQGMITNLRGQASFEVWFVWQGGGIWQEIFDFGRANSPGLSLGGGNYVMLCVYDYAGMLRAEWFGVPGALVLQGPAPPVGVKSQVILSHDQRRQLDKLYLNGQLVASGSTTALFASLSDADNWLARDQWQDPMFDGSYDEFRIWNGALTAGQAASLYASGPDSIIGPGLNISATNGSVILQWPGNAGNFTLQTTAVLNPAAWTTVNLAPTIVNGLRSVTLPAQNAAAYYRLKE